MKDRLKVFLVEGDIQARIAYERHLKYLGHEVVVAKDGRQAVNIYDEDYGYDAIICGVEMGPGDGIFFLDYLKHTVQNDSLLPRILVHNTAKFYTSKHYYVLHLPHDIPNLIQHAEFYERDRRAAYIDVFLERVARAQA